MPIRNRTLQEKGKSFIVLSARATLNQAIVEFEKQKRQANETYLVFSQSKNVYQLALFFDIQQAKKYGVAGETPLQALPIPQPTRIEVQENGNYGELRDWLATHPQSTVLIVNAEGVVQGVFDNPNRGGGSSWLQQLPGVLKIGLVPGKLLRCPKCAYKYELRHIGEWPVFCPNDGTQLSGQ